MEKMVQAVYENGVGDGGEDTSTVHRELRIVVGLPDAAVADVDVEDAGWAASQRPQIQPRRVSVHRHRTVRALVDEGVHGCRFRQ